MNSCNNMMQNKVDIAKKQLAIDISSDKNTMIAINKFISSMLSIGIVDINAIIMLLFDAIYSSNNVISIFDELIKIFPDKTDYILKYFIRPFKENNITNTSVIAKIKEFYTKYGETKTALLIELDYLVNTDFKDIDRIAYIINKVNTINKK